MITIDVSEMKDERDRLAEFLRTKLSAPVEVKGKTLILKPVSPVSTAGDLKTLVKRFLHQRGLSESCRVTLEGDVLRVSRRKHSEGRRSEPKGTGPSSYSTVPYYFPNPP